MLNTSTLAIRIFRLALKINIPNKYYISGLLLILVASLSANPASLSSKITIHLENEKIEVLFEEIRKQTEYGFFFNEENISTLDRITIHKEKATIKEVLDEVLKNTPYTYKLVNDVIVISQKSQDPKKQEKPAKRHIRGHIEDAISGEPIIGATIIGHRSVLGTSSDMDGNFSFVLPGVFDSIVVSYIGYETKYIALENKDEGFVFAALEPDIQEINEVVVTGYQVINKNEITSAVSEIKAEELDLIGALSVDEMLEGKATGLMVTTQSSTPGASAKVRIRSGSTFTGNQSPLWVIDGIVYEDPVPLSADEINSFDNINLIGNALTGVNPQDIESITVLKDASATAIYGTQAANGVIVITTKRGQVGKPTLSYRTSVSYVQAPAYSDFDLMNSKDRIDVSREMYERDLGMVSSYDNYDNLGYEGALKLLWDGTYDYNQFQEQVNYLETLNADWFGALYQPAVNTTHALSASGGAKNVKYYFSVGIDDQQGTEKGVNLNRITSRSNVDLNLTDKLLVSLQYSGSVQKAQYNHSSINVFNTAYYTSRTIPVYETNGDPFYQSQLIFSKGSNRIYGGYNILNEIENSAKNITNKDYSISGNLTWNFLPGFRFSSIISYRNTTNLSEEYITEDTYYVAALRTYMDYEDLSSDLVADYASVPFGGLYGSGTINQDAITFRSQLNYNKSFGSHTLNANLGFESRSTKYHGSTGWLAPGFNYSQGWSFVELPAVGSVAGTGLDVNNYDYKYMINWLTENGDLDIYPTITDRVRNSISAFAILSYIYANKYVLNFNIRSDGSNTFGQYERYKFKPVWSASARWNLHKEAFLYKFDLFDELSLRASYGFRGSMPNASPYLLISDYGRGNATYYPEEVASLSSFPNASLRWEKTTTMNTGLNFSVLKGRVSGVLDYSYSKSEDLLQERPISLVNGSSTYLYNSGSKDVQSFEVSLRTVNIKKKRFSWSTFANFSYDKDRVLEGFEEGLTYTTINNYLNGSIYRTGFPTSGFFSYRFDGLNEEGFPMFENLYDETNGTIVEHLEKVLVYEGTRVPKFYGGFGTEFRYKGLSLRANFSYKLGYKTRLLKLYSSNQSMPLPYENMRSEFNDRWRNPGDEQQTNIPVLSNEEFYFDDDTDPDNYLYTVSNLNYIVPSTSSTAWWMYNYSNIRVVRGDHIRLQSVSLSYNIPSDIINKAKISNANVSFQVANIAVWAFDKRLKGQDPDQVDGLGMPNLPQYNMSLNVSF